MRVEVIVSGVLTAGETGVAIAVFLGAGAGARRLEPQPGRWPWKLQNRSC